MKIVKVKSNFFIVPALIISFQPNIALAKDYNGLAVDKFLGLNNGDFISDSNIDKKGHVSLGAGSSSESITINNGGVMGVQLDATANSTTINAGGTMSVSGDAIDTVINGGKQNVSGTALDTVISNGGQQVVYGKGTANNTTIDNGTQLLQGHSENTTILNGGVQKVQGNGVATNTIINNGSQNVTGKADSTKVNDGGVQRVLSNGLVTSTTINSGGSQIVDVNGHAEDTTINDGVQQVAGTAINTILNGSGKQIVMSGGMAESSVLFDSATISIHEGSTVKDITLHDNSTAFASAGSEIKGTTLIKDYSNLTLELKSDKNSHFDKVSLEGNDSILNVYSEDDGVSNKATINELNNAGTIIFKSKTGNSFSTLLVDGDYTGENGHIRFNTVLGNDSALTDKLVVTGNTFGNTGVSVTNVGGTGDQTLNGIELITVGGQSAGVFTQEGRIVAGAYDYSLVRGQGSKANNWYLTSQNNVPPVDPTDPPVDPTDPPVDPIEPPVNPPVDPVDPPVTPPTSGEHVNRPEGGSYIANLAAANTLFNTRLHDRLGETQYVDALTGEKKVTSLWLRQVGGHNNWRDSSGQLKTQSNSYVAQLGGDVAQWSTDGLNRGHLGLMTGYANSHNQTHSSVTGYDSKGSINGYSAGVYGTWFANDADKSGLYVDSWLQYSWFNNHVNGEQLASESYKSKGLTASLETGYTLKMGEFTGSQGTLNEWFIQPQAQATWMGVKADKHREDNGTRVNSEGDGNVQTRLGMRAYLKSHHAMDEGKARTFEPFIEANWLHNTRSYSAKMDDVRISQAGARNIGEVKVGVEGQINPRLNLWGNVGTQIGDKGYNDSTAMIGVKYNF